MTSTPDQDGRPLTTRLTDTLEHVASSIEVGDAWSSISTRMLEPEWPTRSWNPSGFPTRRRRILVLAAVAAGVAASLLIAVVFGWRPASTTLEPVSDLPEPATSVPRYDPSIPNLVVYRSNVEVIAARQPRGVALSITPERLRTASADVGRAALTALFETTPAHPGNADWLEQKIDLDAVGIQDGLIRVELGGFYSHVFTERAARVMAQAWVRTLQDTLGVRYGVALRVHGRPFLLYGQLDTTQPMQRDESVPVVRPAGFDSPRDGNVVPSTFVMLGTAYASASQPARLVISDPATGRVLLDQAVTTTSARSGPVSIDNVVSLEPGRYRASLTAMSGGRPGESINLTVVR